MTENEELVAFLSLLVIVSVLVGLLPTFIAFGRHHPNRWIILVINVALGATVIGWLGALVWALHAVHRPDTPGHSDGGESGLNIFANDVRAVSLVPRMADRPQQDLQRAVIHIDRLVELRRKQHISEAEYAVLKAAVLRKFTGEGR